MSALLETFKITFKWFGIFLAGVLASTVMVFFTQGDLAATETLVGLGGVSVLGTIIIFAYSLSSRLYSKNVPEQ